MKTIISILLLLGSIGLFFGYTNGKYQDVKASKADIEELQKSLALSKDILAKRSDLQKKYNNFKATDLKALESMLPDYVDNVRLVMDMSSIAKRYAMSLKGITVNKNDGKGDTDTIAPTKNALGSILVSFKVTAPYDTFVKFLRDLEKSLRVVDVTALSFTSSDNGTYDYSVTIKTYWLNQ